MYVLKITDDYDNSTNCTQSVDDENIDNNSIIKVLLLSIAGSVFLLSLISLIIRTTLKLLLTYRNGQISIPNSSGWMYIYRTI